MKKAVLILFVAAGASFSVQCVFGKDVNAPAPTQPVEQKTVEPAAVLDFNQVIMVFDGKELTLGQLQYLSPSPDPETIKKAAEYWLDTQLLYEQAVKQGLDRDEKTTFLADISNKKVFANALINKAVSDIKVDDAQVKKYYDDNKDTDPSLKEPMYLSFSHITLDNPEKAEEAIKKINEGEDINALAKQMSVASDAQKGGRALKYQQSTIESRYGKEFFDALLDAAEGKIIGPIKNKDGKYEVARHEGKKEPKIKDFDKVNGQIKAKLENDAQKNTIESLLNKLREDAKARCVKKGILSEEKKSEQKDNK